MSLFCICVGGKVGDIDVHCLKQQIKSLARHYNCEVEFSVNWAEPILSCFDMDAFTINVLDNLMSNNCDFLLLPDDWYINGLTNSMKFKDRMLLLRDISQTIINVNNTVNIYLGQSGTLPEEFTHFSIKVEELINFLSNTIGNDGVFDGIHIEVTP